MRKLSVLLLSGSLLACGGGDKDAAPQQEALTRRQKDSVIANSKLPGAKAVQGALNAADAAAARQQAADTIH